MPVGPALFADGKHPGYLEQRALDQFPVVGSFSLGPRHDRSFLA